MKKTISKETSPVSPDPTPPQLARRREHRNSSFKMGRTIGEKRERLETRNERNAARKKDKQKKTARILLTTVGFLAVAGILILMFLIFSGKLKSEDLAVSPVESDIVHKATIEIIDEDASSSDRITSRMETYIGRAEKDFRDIGLIPTRAIVPSDAIREVDFYLEGYSGFIKMTIDRDSAISVEDASRMLEYLAGLGIDDFTYIDVRIDGKAYYKVDNVNNGGTE